MNLEAKVGQEHTVVNVENAAAIQNDDVTLPLKQNANFELYDVCVFFSLDAFSIFISLL